MIKYPWFDKALNPNTKANRYKISAARKKQKFDWYYITLAEKIMVNQPTQKCSLHILFCPPVNRARDIDNCLASIKGGLDGLALALGINDKLFRYASLEFGEVVKGGRIEIHIDQSSGYFNLG